MTSVRLVALAAVLLLLCGCVNESKFFPEKEKISSYKELDTDADQEVDAWSYTFEPVNVGSNVSIVRSLLVRQTGELYSAQNFLLINTSGIGTGASNIIIAERIPAELTTSPSDIAFSPNYTSQTGENPLVFEWKLTGVGAQESGGITYTLTTATKMDRAWVEANMLTPSVTVSVSNVQSYPVVAPILGILQNALSLFMPKLGLYPSVGVVLALGFIILLVLWTLVRLVYRTILAIRQRQAFKDMIYAFAGAGQKNNLQYLGVGAVLVALGLASAYLLQSSAAAQAAVQALKPGDFGALVQAYASSPLKAFGSLLLLLGLLAFFFVAVDFAKGLVLGKRYYEAVKKPEELEAAIRESDMLEHIEHTRDEVGQVMQKIGTLAAAGFNFEDETSLLETVVAGLDKAEEGVMKHNYDDARGLMVDARRKYDAAHAAMLKKAEAATKVSAELSALYTVKSDIEAMLIEARRLGADVSEEKRKYGEIGLDEAIEEAKKQASEGKFSEAMADLTKVKDALKLAAASMAQSTSKKKRIKTAPVSEEKLDAVLKTLTSGGKIDAAAVVRRDGLMISARLPAEVDKKVIAAMSARMMDRAEMVSSELKKGEVKYVVADNTQGKIIAMKVGEMAVLICLIKPKGDLGYAILAMETAARNLGALFEGD
ncbi:Roadblock/LC7 domain protein [Candidatus Burarchaeum australiense]|nr:Roadblock/LC7 domain protein [Candidatus Burarchaeum australiense]